MKVHRSIMELRRLPRFVQHEYFQHLDFNYNRESKWLIEVLMLNYSFYYVMRRRKHLNVI